MEPEPNAGGFALVLTNRHLLDVNIFLQHDGQADRIAMVNASSSKTMELPLYMLGQGGVIRLIAEPIGDTQQGAAGIGRLGAEQQQRALGPAQADRRLVNSALDVLHS